MSALVFSHIPLPHPFLQSSFPPPPFPLSPSLIIPSLYLFTNLLPHQSQSDFLAPASIPRNAHSQTRKYGADSFISYTKHVQKNTCAYYKYAFCTGTVSKRQMPANASKTNGTVHTGNKKMINKNTWKHRKIRCSHNRTCFGSLLLFLSTEVWAYELLPSFPPSFPLPQETTQFAWEQEDLFTG